MTAPESATNNINGHPSGDERFIAIDQTMQQFGHERDALLEVLNSAQETFGYLSRDLLIYISRQLNVPMSQVYGVATFYHLFTFVPLGDHNCNVCTGTACYVKGATRIVETLCEEFDIKVGETTPDGIFSLTTARCLGSCGLAPVVVLDGIISGKTTPDGVTNRVHELLSSSKERQKEQAEAG